LLPVRSAIPSEIVSSSGSPMPIAEKQIVDESFLRDALRELR